MRDWKVWITGYPDSGVVVQATGIDEAVRKAALTQGASHHGEVVEINAQRTLSTIVYRYQIRIHRGGRVRFEGKL